MKEAMFYEKKDGTVDCFLCSHRCKGIKENKTGICGVRRNHGGILCSEVYGRLVAANIDPIEKKPFFNYLPGSMAYSIATVGCNFRCRNCQNSDISQAPREGRGIVGTETEPEEVVSEALATGCESMAYTYTEPTIFFEYAYDVSVLAEKEGIKNLFVTNGYMTGEMLDFYCKHLDAANVDLKSFSDKTYQELCGARLDPVLDSLRMMKKRKVWVEITTLLIPGINDSREELEGIAGFIKSELGAETPWHISRFHPDYKLMDVPATKPESITASRKIGLDAGLRYVYAGNLPGDVGENTYCPKCGTNVIERNCYIILKKRMKGDRCSVCKTRIDGLFEEKDGKNA